MMKFEEALIYINKGEKMGRLGWDGDGMYIELQTPTPYSKMTLPYIYLYTSEGDLVPWFASQSDILSTDWVKY